MNWNRTFASSMVLAVLMVMAVGQAPAIETRNELKPKELKALIASASSPADHMKLSRHYTAMAAKHEAEAKEHDDLAIQYGQNPPPGASKHPMAGNTAEHCKFFAEHCREAAKEMTAMATAHEEMAKNWVK